VFSYKSHYQYWDKLFSLFTSFC